MKTIYLPIVVLLALGAGACREPTPTEYPTQRVWNHDTTLQPGDVFEIRVYREKEMTGSYQVSPEGTIIFPLLNEVKVEGKTPAGVARMLQEKLTAGEFLRKPYVSVIVKERATRITVMGEVKKAGAFPWREGMRILEALALAGGFSNMARKNSVRVTRTAGDKAVEYIVPVRSIREAREPPFYMRPGDVVFIDRRAW